MKLNVHKFGKMFALGGLCFIAAFSKPAMIDATISIDRALNSPTLTVRYEGAHASLIELRINGESVGTRSASQAKDSGESNFTVDLASLHDGDNAVEVRLFDKDGHLVGTEKTIITTDSSAPAPFFMNAPKMGDTVQGPVELTVGFNRTFSGSFVSFFIDNQLKSMTNTPPYTYLWDSSNESNGWHELESWLVDDSSTTYKTRKIRVFVNNPQGKTPRHLEFRVKDAAKATVPAKTSTQVDLSPEANPSEAGHLIGGTAGAKGSKHSGASASPTELDTMSPNFVDGQANLNRTKIRGAMSTLKAVRGARGVASGPKFLTPTGKRYVQGGKVTAGLKGAISAVGPVLNGVHLMPITKGSRIPNLSTFAIVMNGDFVDFDVAPRVDDGIPMTPLRYLLEKDGGKVDWQNVSKTVIAHAGGKTIYVKIGDTYAKIDHAPVEMERAAYLEGNRTIVPLSFIRDVLKVDVQYDKATGHVLITSLAK